MLRNKSKNESQLSESTKPFMHRNPNKIPVNTHIRIRYIFNVVILRAKFQKCKFIDHNTCAAWKLATIFLVTVSISFRVCVCVRARVYVSYPKHFESVATTVRINNHRWFDSSIYLCVCARSSGVSVGRIGRQCWASCWIDYWIY